MEYITYNALLITAGAGCSSEVECSLMVRWVVGLILHGPMKLFLVPASDSCITANIC